MAENAETIASFDHEIREVIQAALDHEISRNAIAGVIMSVAADFNSSKPLLAAYPDAAGK